MSQQVNIGVPRHISASGTLCQPGGELLALVCTAAASVTITEGTASGGATLFDAFAMTDGQAITNINARFPRGAYITLTGTVTAVLG
jgi:hypothetical protein